MSETVKYEQMSIYDFLPEEKSQEIEIFPASAEMVATSESLSQVDEAQDVFTPEMRELTPYELEHGVDLTPSSALDTVATKVFHKMAKDLEEEILAEDTDNVVTNSTLFSVGDVLTVRQASDVYNADEQPEDFYYIKEYEGEQVKLLNIRGDLLLCNTFNLDRNIWLRAQELIKI